MQIRSTKSTHFIALVLYAGSLSMSAAEAAAPKKYAFVTTDTMAEDGHKLTRIRRLSDGVLGGYIESENNLSQTGASFLDDKSRAFGQARITDDAQLHGLARDSGQLSGRSAVYGAVSGNGQVKDNAVVYGQVYDNGIVDENATVNGQVFGNGRVGGHAKVYGRVSGNASIGGDETIYGDRQ
jgi:hypothetical protein